MSQHIYRKVINKTQELLVAKMRPTYGLLVLMFPMLAFAQIVADPGAPANQRPTILNAGNGVPVVNIQTPSAAGVSRNTYTQFDVQQQGAILNNSRNNVSTQQAGFVQGNPWLAGGTARVILNEVNSSNPSLLRGFVEVAGDRAQVVIANPAGVTCDGCGFINANRATLTTGTPIMSGGNLDGYRVQGGTITITGTGLSSSGADYTDIIARAVQVNAGIWAQNLNIVAGTNDVSADTSQVTRQTGNGAAPAVGIDVSALGGMYAGKITLVGTEAGVGVRNAGNIGATSGQVTITADGRLENSGVIFAQGNLNATVQQTLENSGKIQSAAQASITATDINNVAGSEVSADTTILAATGTIVNRGLVNGNTTRIDAPIVRNIGTGLIIGTQLSIGTSELDNDTETVSGVRSDATIAARSRLDLGVDTLNNREHALIFSAGTTADAMNIGGALDNQGQATGSATAVNNQSATIESMGGMSISASSVLNSNEHFSTAVTSVGSPQGMTQYNLSGGDVERGSDLSTRFTPGQVYTYDCEATCLRVIATGDASDAWVQYNFTRTSQESVVTLSDPGKISATGALNWNVLSLLNDKSQIIAGGNIGGSVGTLNNTTVAGQHIDRDIGSATYYSRHRRPGRDNSNISSGGYDSGDVTTAIDLTPTIYQGNTATAGSGTVIIGLSGGSGSLFHVVPGRNYIQETDPRFANYGTWLSSDYLLSALSYDPATVQKRLGDGFYEQKLVREQVAQLTGRRFLNGYSDDEAEYLALMNNGSTFAQAQSLRPGIALTAAQMAQLTSDIVWLVEKEVTLPNGQLTRALVPQVYVKVQEGDLKPSGALIAGNNINLSLTGDLKNQGSIVGRNVLALTAENINNLGGSMQAKDIGIAARNDVNIIGGSLTAENSLTVTAGHDLNVTSTTSTQTSSQASRTNIDRVAGLYVSGNGGTLIAAAGNDIALNAAFISNSGNGGTTTLAAARDLNLGTVTESSNTSIRWDSKNYRNESSRTDIGTTIQTQGDLSLQAGNNVNAKAANVASMQGALNVVANNSINLTAGEANITLDEGHQSTSKGTFSKRTLTTRDTLDQTEALGSSFAGNQVQLQAVNNVTIQGGRIDATAGASILAGQDVNLVAAESTRTESHSREEKKSGLTASFKAGMNIGKSSNQESLDTVETNAVGSTLSGANVQIGAVRNVAITGSSVLADQDVNIAAGQNITLDSAYNRTDSKSASKSSSTSIGLDGNLAGSLSVYNNNKATQNGTGSAASAVTSLVSANSGNLTMVAGGAGSNDAIIRSQGADLLAGQSITLEADRIDLLAAANTASSANHSESKSFSIGAKPAGAIGGLINAAGERLLNRDSSGNKRLDNALDLKAGYDAFKAGSLLSDAINGKATDLGKNAIELNPEKGGTGSAFGVSISVGSSKSESNSENASSQAYGSNLQAKDIDITARQTDIHLEGAKLQAENVTLTAARDVLLDAAANTASLHSDNKSSSVSVGVTVGFGQQNGISLQLGAQNGKGYANGSETIYDNTLITATNALKVKSGQDTTLKGAQLAANTVTMDVGRNLNIETLQDSSKYEMEQKSSGWGISLCVPPFCYGTSSASVNASKQSIKHDYLSAVGQSGIAAGAGGFDIKVGQNTDLVGAAITSDANASQNKLQTASLTSRDLDNHQDTQSKNSSFALSGSFAMDGLDGTKNALPNKDGDLVDVKAQGGLTQIANNIGSNALSGLAGKGVLPANGSEQSKTLSVISPATITLTGTGNADKDAQSQATAGELQTRDPKTANQSLTNTLTLQQASQIDQKLKTLQQNQQAAQILAGVGQQLASDIGDYAQKRVAELNKQISEAQTPDKAEALKQELKDFNDNWGEGKPYRVAMHTLVGALVGGKDGALGAAASALVVPEAAKLILSSDLPQEVKAPLIALAGTAIGGIVGGEKGAIAGLSQTTNNYLKHADVDRLSAKLKQCGSDTSCRDKAIEDMRQISAINDAELLRCKATNNCDQLISEYREGYAALGKLRKDGASQDEVGKLLVMGYYANDVISRNLQNKMCETDACVERALVLKGMGQGLSKITPIGLVVGAGTTTYALTSAIMANGLDDTVVSIVQGIGNLPSELKTRLNSPDPAVRGEAVVDALSLAAVATTVTTKLGQLGFGALAKTAETKVFNGIEINPKLPDPVAGWDYSPSLVKGAKTENQLYSHWTGFQAEVKLANEVAEQGQTVLKWGDKVGAQGSDVISVNPKTGDVVLWDSKYRSSSTTLDQSPTFAKPATRSSAIEEAAQAVRESNLAPDVKLKALDNLQQGNVTTNTVGAGNAKNSVQVKYCNNKAC